MGQSIPIFQGQAFDPETLALLAASYDRAFNILTTTGELRTRPDDITELLAQRIVELAKQGERDETRITIQALKFVRGSELLAENSSPLRSVAAAREVRRAWSV